MSCPAPRVLYLKVLEEGAHRECVHTSSVGEGVTVYRSHVGGPYHFGQSPLYEFEI